MTECKICGRSELVYTVDRQRGPIDICIPCLAVRRGQERSTGDASIHSDEMIESMVESTYSWFSVLARIHDDSPILKREREYSVDDSTAEFLTNIMGSDAYAKPSEIAESDVDVAQRTFGDGGEA